MLQVTALRILLLLLMIITCPGHGQYVPRPPPLVPPLIVPLPIVPPPIVPPPFVPPPFVPPVVVPPPPIVPPVVGPVVVPPTINPTHLLLMGLLAATLLKKGIGTRQPFERSFFGGEAVWLNQLYSSCHYYSETSI